MTAQPITLAPALEPADTPIVVGLLGPMHILGGPGPSAARMRRTLALLALRAGEHVPLGDFYRELLDVTPVTKPAQSIQTYVMLLRRKFPELPIETSHGGYRLNADRCEIDALRYGVLTAQARRQFHDDELLAAVDTLRAAASLWRGWPLVDVNCGPLLSNMAAEIMDRRAGALDLQWEIELRLGHHREIVDVLSAAVRSNPGREDTAAKLMLALYRSNRRADALRVFQQVRTALVDEYGLEPCPALSRLQGQILAGDPRLDLPAVDGGAA